MWSCDLKNLALVPMLSFHFETEKGKSAVRTVCGWAYPQTFPAQVECCHFSSQLGGWWKGNISGPQHVEAVMEAMMMKPEESLPNHFWEIAKGHHLRSVSRQTISARKYRVPTRSLVNVLVARRMWTARQESLWMNIRDSSSWASQVGLESVSYIDLFHVLLGAAILP